MFSGRAFKAATSLASNTALKNCLQSSIRFECISARAVLNHVPRPELTALKNGVRVVSENNGKRTATVGIWVDAGVNCEDYDNNGVGNFLERMIYKGTTKRSAVQLQEDLDKIGARLWSYVERDRTAYFAECGSKDIDNVVEIIADVVRNSKLDEGTIELERKRILEDMEAYEENPREVVFGFLHSAAFQGTPYEKSILGTTDGIRSITRNKLKHFREDYYSPNRLVLTGVGGVDHTKLVHLSEKYFGDLIPDKQPIPLKTGDGAGVRFTGSEIRYRNDNLPFMYGAMAVEGTEFGHPDNIPLHLVKTLVGEWNPTVATSHNSPNRLVQKVCLIPDIRHYESFAMHYKNCGLFGVYFVAQGKHIDFLLQFVKAVQREWKHMTTGVTGDEIDRAKNALKTNIFSLFESNSERADHLSRYVLCKNMAPSLVDLEESIEAVNEMVLRDAVTRNIYDRDLATAGTGKTEAFPEYLIIRYGMSWWRL